MTEKEESGQVNINKKTRTESQGRRPSTLIDEIENRERKARTEIKMQQEDDNINNEEDLGGESKANKQEI